MLKTVNIPKEFEPVFKKAEAYVDKYFKQKIEDPSKGTIEIFGERYILVRAASMSVEFFETITKLYSDYGEQTAFDIATSLLFDIAHSIGKTDARNFHKKMGVKDPIEKLSAGPIHFSYSGWAFVDIFPESKPTPDENYYLIYDHPYSFEADSWKKRGKKTELPICAMNAGYSSGWCEESFGIPLVTAEILCRGRGDDTCRFIMAHPSKIQQYIDEYLKQHSEIAGRTAKYNLYNFLDKRKQLEKSLRDSEYKYRTLLENLPQRIFSKDKDLVYISCNENYANDLKIKPHEIAGKTDYDFYPKALAEKYRTDDKEIIQSGQTRDIEERYTENGQQKFVHTVKTPLKNEQGKVIGMTGIFWDVTDHKKAEEAILKAKNEWEDTFNSINDIVTIHDLDFNIVRANKAAETAFGLAAQSLIRKKCYQVYHHRGCPPEGCPSCHVGKTGMPVTSEFYEPALNSYVEIKAYPRFDENNNIIGVIHVARDITKRKKMEEHILQLSHLREALLTPRTLAEKLKLVTDAIVSIFNVDFVRIWIIKPGDICDAGCVHSTVGNEPNICRHKDRCLHLLASSGRYTHIDGKVHRRVPFGCYKIGRIASGEIAEFLTNDVVNDSLVHDHEWVKKLGLVSSAGYRITSSEQSPLGVMALFSKNIIDTEENTMLKSLASTLSQVIQTSVAEESLELLNKDLKATIEKLFVANRELQEFAHITAHDLKAPLRGISSLAEWLATDYADKFDDEGRKSVHLLMNRVNMLYGHIDNISKYSEIGRVTVEKSEVNLNKLIGEITDSIAPAENIKIVTDGHLPTIMCEKIHMTQIFQNLISNAVKYLDKPAGLITVSCADENGFWKFSVADNGPGIEEKYFDKIFKIFQTLQTNDANKSTGIGLAIVKKIVESYGGRVWVESKVGQGSTFAFTLPKQKQQQEVISNG